MTQPVERDGRTIYVPKPDSELRQMILAGSGIVGTPIPDSGWILIDYEGNRYDAPMLRTYETRVEIAHGRHIQSAPTVARAACDGAELIEVGSYDPDTKTIHIERQDVVDDWCAIAGGNR